MKSVNWMGYRDVSVLFTARNSRQWPFSEQNAAFDIRVVFVGAAMVSDAFISNANGDGAGRQIQIDQTFVLKYPIVADLLHLTPPPKVPRKINGRGFSTGIVRYCFNGESPKEIACGHGVGDVFRCERDVNRALFFPRNTNLERAFDQILVISAGKSMTLVRFSLRIYGHVAIEACFFILIRRVLVHRALHQEAGTSGRPGKCELMALGTSGIRCKFFGSQDSMRRLSWNIGRQYGSQRRVTRDASDAQVRNRIRRFCKGIRFRSVAALAKRL